MKHTTSTRAHKILAAARLAGRYALAAAALSGALGLGAVGQAPEAPAATTVNVQNKGNHIPPVIALNPQPLPPIRK